jgi:transposase
MRYELSNDEWIVIKPMLPNKPRGTPRVNDRLAQIATIRSALARVSIEP